MTVTTYPNFVAGERVEGARHAIEFFTTTKTAYVMSRDRRPGSTPSAGRDSDRPSR